MHEVRCRPEPEPEAEPEPEPQPESEAELQARQEAARDLTNVCFVMRRAMGGVKCPAASSEPRGTIIDQLSTN